MDAIEFQRLIDSERARFEAEISELRERVERYRKLLSKSEGQLGGAREAHAARIERLSRIYAGFTEESESASTPSQDTEGDNGERKRTKRGSLDEPIVTLACGIGSPETTVSDIVDAWNARNAIKVTRSTVRGIFEREAKRPCPRIVIAARGANGSANPTRYRVVTASKEA